MKTLKQTLNESFQVNESLRKGKSIKFDELEVGKKYEFSNRNLGVTKAEIVSIDHKKGKVMFKNLDFLDSGLGLHSHTKWTLDNGWVIKEL